MKKENELEILKAYEEFPKDKQTLIISSANSKNDPLTNYAPFVLKDDFYYVTMSKSMPHYKNLTESKKAHIMLIEDEANASHPFARKRVYFQASCEEVSKFEHYNLFENKFGDKLSFIKEMGDFVVIKLRPKEISLVFGFGQAYLINENKELVYKSISHK